MTRRDYVLLSTALHRAYVNSTAAGRVGVFAAAQHIGHDIALRSSGFNIAQFLEQTVEGHTA